jgi:hypothetical protein
MDVKSNSSPFRSSRPYPSSVKFGPAHATVVIVLIVAILVVLVVVGREVYRALHPPNKPMRKRKRRTF